MSALQNDPELDRFRRVKVNDAERQQVTREFQKRGSLLIRRRPPLGFLKLRHSLSQHDVGKSP